MFAVAAASKMKFSLLGLYGNLLKEFGDSPLNKRKQTFIKPTSKKQCLDTEKLLVEDVSDCLEVTVTESEDTELIIMNTFAHNWFCNI